VRRLLDAPFCSSEFVTVPFGKEDLWYIFTRDWGHEPILIYSGGVGKSISAELELTRYFDCRIELFDPSPTGLRTMSEPANRDPRITFHPIGLGAVTGQLAFDPPRNAEEGSFRLPEQSAGALSFDCVALSEFAARNNTLKIDLLKLDIEGFEYGVLEDVLSSKLDIRQICVEFHHFLPGRTRDDTARAIALLRRNGYRIIHKRGTDFTLLKV
jgi:FkbM family methyltransferase